MDPRRFDAAASRAARADHCRGERGPVRAGERHATRSPSAQGRLAADAAAKGWTHVEYLRRLLEGECRARQQRAIERRVRAARFPVVKTMDQFRWDWPKKINELQVKNLFRLTLVEKKTNVILMGGVGLGKTHVGSALAYEACQRGHSVLFTTAVDALNNLVAAQAAQRLKAELKRYLAPAVLVLDELGYLRWTRSAPICCSK